MISKNNNYREIENSNGHRVFDSPRGRIILSRPKVIETPGVYDEWTKDKGNNLVYHTKRIVKEGDLGFYFEAGWGTLQGYVFVNREVENEEVISSALEAVFRGIPFSGDEKDYVRGIEE